MPSFGKRSRERLVTASWDLQVLFNEVVKTFDCSVLCGHRNQEEQDAAFPKFTQVKWPNSKHNQHPSLAIDVVPYPVDWKNTQRMYMFAGYVLGVARRLYDEGVIDYEIRTGADWDGDTLTDDQTFIDLPHFELGKHRSQ